MKKSIEKAVKVEAAALTLGELAVSPNRGWIAALDIDVQCIPLPPKHHIYLQLDDFTVWCPPAANLKHFLQDLRKDAAPSTDTEIAVMTKVRSECELVARVADNTTILADAQLIPYVCYSKLHCFSCYLWLEIFNREHSTKVSFDGSHGGVKPGWWPPTLGAPDHDRILLQMQERLEDEITVQTHGKQASASSTSSDPSSSLANRLLRLRSSSSLVGLIH